MKHLTLFLYALLTAFTTTAQLDTVQCGTDGIIIRNPFLVERMNSRTSCDPEVDLDTAQVLSIPVVVHVLHLGEGLGEGTNISDEQVFSCIQNLNDRYRGNVDALAALTDEYDADELALVIDSKIEFCLVSIDPDGNATNGIDRHDCSDLEYTNNFAGQTSTAYYAEKGISNDGQWAIPLTGIPDNILKDIYHWPIEDYFNMYVVSEINGNDGGGGIQGYSYVGSLGNSISGDAYGPVCLYNVTGTTGELKWNRTLNSTWTHEIGHALGLYHTFGVFGDDCDSELNPCTYGDQVADTPPTSSNQSCTPAFADCPDAMLENYMDYTPEACKTAFTQGQIEKMRNEIYTGLPYLLETNDVVCDPPCPEVECPTDIDGDGSTGTSDLLLFLQYYQVEPADCSPYDFNHDNAISTYDLMFLLSNYGTICTGGFISESIDNVTEPLPSNHRIAGTCMYFDVSGRQVEPGDLSQGIYIIVEQWSDGTVSTKKVFRLN